MGRLGLVVIVLAMTIGCSLRYPPPDPKIKPAKPTAQIEELLAEPALVTPTESRREPLKFLHPKVAFAVANPYGGVEVPVQVWVEPHPENRALHISYCAGQTTRQLEGDWSGQIHPAEKALMVRLHESCDITARLIGPGGKVLHQVTLSFTIQ